MLLKYKINKKGFTLLETTIALGILVVGILAVLTLSTASITLSQVSEQNIVVANLAREGIEVVREIRDFSKSGNVVTVFDNENIRFFEDGIHSLVSDGCYVVDSGSKFYLKSSNLATGVNCSGDSFSIDSCANCQLYQDVVGHYSHIDTGSATAFRRVVKIISASAAEKKVLSKVVWSERGRSHQFVLETYLTDW